MLRAFYFLFSRAVLDLSSVASDQHIDSLKLGIQLITHAFLPERKVILSHFPEYSGTLGIFEPHYRCLLQFSTNIY